MDMTYFREFVVLADTLNFWAAAERLFIGEPSLSKHIKALERELGAPLFARTSRKVELTEFGKLMLPYAQAAANLQYEYQSAAFRYLNQENLPLSIATIPVIAQYNITDALVNFQADHPTIQMDIYEADTLVVRKRLIERKCTLGIYRDSALYLSHEPDTEAQLVKIPYCHDRLMAVLPLNRPLANEKQIELIQLSSEPFSLIRQDTMPYDLCVRACQEAGFNPRVVFNSHNLEAILDMVRKGSCVSLLFSNHISYSPRIVSDIHPPFAVIPVVPEIRTTVCLSYLKSTKLSQAALRFIDYFKLVQPNRSEPG